MLAVLRRGVRCGMLVELLSKAALGRACSPTACPRGCPAPRCVARQKSQQHQLSARKNPTSNTKGLHFAIFFPPSVLPSCK